MRHALIAATLAVGFTTAALAASTLAYTTDYATYDVHGTTAAELLADMNRHPIDDPDSGHAYANITHHHDLQIATAETGGQRTVSRLTFTWHFVITTPVAPADDRMSNRTRMAWRNFTAALAKHEERHRQIFLDCGQDFVAAAGRLTALQCGLLDAAVKSFIDDRYATCMEKQRAFDAKDTPRLLAMPFIRDARAGK